MQSSLNQFMRLGREEWRRVREAVTGILREDNPKLRDNASLRNEVLIPMVRAISAVGSVMLEWVSLPSA